MVEEGVGSGNFDNKRERDSFFFYWVGMREREK